MPIHRVRPLSSPLDPCGFHSLPSMSPYFTLHALSCLSNDPSAIFLIFHLPHAIRRCHILCSGLATRLHTSLPVTSTLIAPSLFSSHHSWYPHFFQTLSYLPHLTLSPPWFSHHAFHWPGSLLHSPSSSPHSHTSCFPHVILHTSCSITVVSLHSP